jgi:hypothetical protein
VMSAATERPAGPHSWLCAWLAAAAGCDARPARARARPGFLGRSICFTLVFARFWPVWAPRSLPCGLGSAGVAVCATAAVSVPKLVIAVRNSRLDRDRSSFPFLPPTSTYSNARKVNKLIDSKRTVEYLEYHRYLLLLLRSTSYTYYYGVPVVPSIGILGVVVVTLRLLSS